jgi:hypothetical protein
MPYNSKKQGAGPIEWFSQNVRFQQVFAVPDCCPVVFKAYQNSLKERISSMGSRGSLGEVIKPQTWVLLAILLTGFDVKNLQCYSSPSWPISNKKLTATGFLVFFATFHMSMIQ